MQHSCRSQVDVICRCIAVAAHTGELGDGKIFCYPVTDIVRMYASAALLQCHRSIALLLKQSQMYIACVLHQNGCENKCRNSSAHKHRDCSRTAETGGQAEKMAGGREDLLSSDEN